jgi:hypothetical protein
VGWIPNVKLNDSHALVESRECFAARVVPGCGVDAGRPTLEQRVDECAADTTIRAGDKGDGVFEVHTALSMVMVTSASVAYLSLMSR